MTHLPGPIDTVDLVALSLLPISWWRSVGERLRAGDTPRHIFDRLLAERCPGQPDKPAGAAVACRCGSRPSGRARHHADSVERRGVSAGALRHHRSAARAVAARPGRGARSARGRNRGVAGGDAVRIGGRGAAGRRFGGARRRHRLRPGARRGFGGPSRRAGGGGVHRGGSWVGRRRRLSSRARSPGARDRAPRRHPERARAGNAATEALLPAAQSPHQRPLPRGRRHRGGREERVAHHGALCARSGTRCAGGARQRAHRPQPRRTWPFAGRCKDCGVGGRYLGGAGNGGGPDKGSGVLFRKNGPEKDSRPHSKIRSWAVSRPANRPIWTRSRSEPA